MEDLLTGSEQVHVIAEAVKETNPEEDKVDTFIYERIICSDDDNASVSDQPHSKMRSKITELTDMDDFINNLHSEQKRHKSKSLTTIYEMQNNEIEDINN